MIDEYIRKDVALDALKAQADTMQSWVERYAEQRRGILTAVNIIEDVEPADVAPVVHGRWVDADFCGQYECSECGNNAVDLYDFCPHCGVKMDGEKRK